MKLKSPNFIQSNYTEKSFHIAICSSVKETEEEEERIPHDSVAFRTTFKRNNLN